MRITTRLSLACLPLLAVAVASFADESTDLSLAHAIKAEAFERSKVMEHLAALTDVHGPRLTASPNFQAAGEWAKARLESYGLTNAALESWGPFGRSWTYTRLRLDLAEPQYARLRGFPLAWSAGTERPISSEPILTPIDRKRDPSKDKEEIAKYLMQSAAVMAYCVAEAARLAEPFPRKPLPRPRRPLEESLKDGAPGAR